MIIFQNNKINKHKTQQINKLLSNLTKCKTNYTQKTQQKNNNNIKQNYIVPHTTTFTPKQKNDFETKRKINVTLKSIFISLNDTLVT